MERRRIEAINDVQNKNESLAHAALKSRICELMREISHTYEKKSVETEVYVKGVGKVDVVATIENVTLAVECGNTQPEKIRALRERFDIVLHVPYCYTEDLCGLKKDELDHQILAVDLFKRLKAAGFEPERGKHICLEDGECSLPSGREGFPHEAIQMASGHTEEWQVK